MKNKLVACGAELEGAYYVELAQLPIIAGNSGDAFSGFIEGAGTFTAVNEDFLDSFITPWVPDHMVVVYVAATGRYFEVTPPEMGLVTSDNAAILAALTDRTYSMNTLADAKAYFFMCKLAFGQGFHPDVNGAGYATSEGMRTFSDVQADAYDDLLTKAADLFNDEELCHYTWCALHVLDMTWEELGTGDMDQSLYVV